MRAAAVRRDDSFRGRSAFGAGGYRLQVAVDDAVSVHSHWRHTDI